MDAPIDVQFRWPGNRVPVTVLLDDALPCGNPAWYEFPEQGHVAEVPNSFTERFAEMIERTGSAGKVSVIPFPGARGRIDQELPGVSQGQIREFVGIVRDRVAPRWDISPELITHNKAVDLQTMQPLEEREDVWAAHQDEATLTKYISLALQILRNVGLEPNGVTSPWALGREVEEAYANAIQTSLLEVCGVRVGWYFLHVDSRSPGVPPRVMRLDPEAGTSLVSIVSASRETSSKHYDFAWRTQYREPAEIDSALTADGRGGRLAELFSHGGPMAFHTHWQSLFSNGTGAGLDALEELCLRINRAWGERVRWTSARELAIYCSARAATEISRGGDGRSITLRAPFECFEFTAAIPIARAATTLSLDGQVLNRLPDGPTPLREGTWCLDGGKAHVCFPLRDGGTLSWT